jgi:MoxR-like ATPase
MKKVKSFKDFVLNEYSSYVSEGIGEKIGDWVKSLVSKIKEGVLKLIPSGEKKGVPVVAYFDPKEGSIVSQINKFYSGTEFSKKNPIEVYEGYDANSWDEIEEARVPLEYTGEDQTVRDVNATELKEMLEKLYRSKVRGGRAKPIFIFGAPGIGKTQIVGQAADSLGVPMINIDLQFMAPEDFLGIPKVIDIKQPEIEGSEVKSPGMGMTRSNPPVWLPRTNGEGDKGGFIFMDEMNRANKIVLNSVMQFVQMGRLGEYRLPDKWVIVAAGNRPSEASVEEFDFALADRFTIVNFVPTTGEWAEWARSSGKFQPEFIDFVERNEELFHYLDTEKATLKFPTPRSWTDAAMNLKDELDDIGAKNWKDLPTDVIYKIYADQIGPSAAGKLKAYLDVIRKVSEQDLSEIVQKPKEARLLPKTGDFSNIIYGVYEMALRKAEEMNGGEATPQDLFNIMEYFNRYEQIEALTWIYKRIMEKYPKFAVTDEVLKTKDEEDSKLKINAARMIQAGGKAKGVI